MTKYCKRFLELINTFGTAQAVAKASYDQEDLFGRMSFDDVDYLYKSGTLSQMPCSCIKNEIRRRNNKPTPAEADKLKQ